MAVTADKLLGRQDMGGPHSGMKTTLIPGDPTSRGMGQYGKGHSFFSAPMRNAKGGMRDHPNEGGMAPQDSTMEGL